MATQKDARGKIVTSNIDLTAGTLTSVTDPKGQTVNYQYDTLKRTTGVHTTISSKTYRNAYPYTHARLGIDHPLPLGLALALTLGLTSCHPSRHIIQEETRQEEDTHTKIDKIENINSVLSSSACEQLNIVITEFDLSDTPRIIRRIEISKNTQQKDSISTSQENALQSTQIVSVVQDTTREEKVEESARKRPFSGRVAFFLGFIFALVLVFGFRNIRNRLKTY